MTQPTSPSTTSHHAKATGAPFPAAHRRQFIFGPKAIKAASDWDARALDNGYVLSHCPELLINEARDKNGAQWLILGLAVNSADTRSPAAIIAEHETAQIPALSHQWAGRWLLISPSHIYLDASALLGCVYTKTNDASLWVSNSVALLSHYLSSPDLQTEKDAHKDTFTEKIDPRTLIYERGLAWVPPPFTPFKAIKRLLASQALDLKSAAVKARALMPGIEPGRSFDDGIERITARLTTTMAALARAQDVPLWLGLTAGYDSRLMLALAQKAGIGLRPFTRLTRRMSVADRVTPPILARRAGFPHRIMAPARAAKGRIALLSQHAPALVSDGDAAPFLSAARADMDGVIIGGHGFSIASGFSNWRDLPDAMPAPQEAAAQFMALLGEPSHSTAQYGLQEWFQWAHQSPQDHLDWRDRLFLEQRQAGWLAAKEQIYDMDRAMRFPILNCAALYADILSLAPADRLGSKLQKEMIARLSPDLAGLDYNPRDRQFALRYPHWVLLRQWHDLTRR